MAAVSFREATRILAERDPVIARLAAEAGPFSVPFQRQSYFFELVRAITYQQIAGAAARAIHGRLVAAVDGEVTPERIAALSPETLRAVGMSRNKALSVVDLAEKVLDGTVILEPRRLGRLSDQEVMDRLTQVRGIGTWTAEVFMLFNLRRLDIWLVGDLGVRRGFGLAWKIPTPTAKQLEPLGEPFRPYRSVVTWYCWRAAELYGGAQASVLTGSKAPLP